MRLTFVNPKSFIGILRNYAGGNKLGSAFSKIQSVWYTGNTFSCPFCKGNFRKMKPYKASYYIKGQLVDHYTENAKCYRCGSNIRQRFIATFSMNNTNILRSRIKLLHFAPGRTMFSLLKSQQNIEYIT